MGWHLSLAPPPPLPPAHAQASGSGWPAVLVGFKATGPAGPQAVQAKGMTGSTCSARPHWTASLGLSPQPQLTGTGPGTSNYGSPPPKTCVITMRAPEWPCGRRRAWVSGAPGMLSELSYFVSCETLGKSCLNGCSTAWDEDELSVNGRIARPTFHTKNPEITPACLGPWPYIPCVSKS